MSDETPSIDEWRKFLIEEMSVLDKVWEQDLDDLWTFTPERLARHVAEFADEFYQAYWDMFRATVQNTGKPWEQMKREAQAAAIEAQEKVARAWASVVGDKIDRVERDLESSTKQPRVPLLKAKQLMRHAKDMKAKAEKAVTRGGDHATAIGCFREAVNFAIQSDEELEEAKRQAELASEQRKATSFTIRLTLWRLIVAAIVGLAAIASLVFGIYQYFASGNGGE